MHLSFTVKNTLTPRGRRHYVASHHTRRANVLRNNPKRKTLDRKAGRLMISARLTAVLGFTFYVLIFKNTPMSGANTTVFYSGSATSISKSRSAAGTRSNRGDSLFRRKSASRAHNQPRAVR